MPATLPPEAGGDAEHLSLLSQTAQQPTDNLSHTAADAYVHLVENKRGMLPQRMVAT